MVSSNDSGQGSRGGLDGEGRPYRTLYVGIGGTGKDMLLRVRRFIFERWRVKSLPFTRFLWLDTDINGTSPDDIKDPITREIDFENNEKIDLGMSLSELENYFRGAQTDFVTGHQEATHPRDFLDIDRLAPMVDALSDGAGQIRCFGRLAFWHHAHTFGKAVERAILDLSNGELHQTVRDGGYGFQGVDDKYRFVVCAGIAGGTGSGAFIDAGVFLKHLFMKQTGEKAESSAMLILPSVFDALNLPDCRKEDLNANGYAAMMELDYHLRDAQAGSDKARDGDPQFRYKFPQVAELVEVATPVYQQAFLFENQRVDGQTFEDPRAPFRVPADALAAELDTSEAAQQLRSELSNMKNKLSGNEITIQDKQGQPQYSLALHVRYASMGHASVVLDRDRLRNAASYQLGVELMRFMQGGGRDVNTLGTQIRERLARSDGNGVGLSIAQIKKGLLRVEEGDAGMLDSSLSELKARTTAIEEDLHRALSLTGTDSKPQKVLDALDAKLREAEISYRKIEKELSEKVQKEVAQGGTSDYRGRQANVIEANITKVYEGLVGRLKDTKNGMLADPDEQGIPAVAKLLKEADALVKDYRRSLEDERVDDVEEPTRPGVNDGAAIQAALSFQREARAIPSIMIPFRGLAEGEADDRLSKAIRDDLKSLRPKLDAYMRAWCERIESVLTGHYDELVLPHTEGILKKLEGHLGSETTVTSAGGQTETTRTGLRKELNEYAEKLKGLEETQQRMALAFENAKRGTRHHFCDVDIKVEEELYRCLSKTPRDQAYTQTSGEKRLLLRDHLDRFVKDSGYDAAGLSLRQAQQRVGEAATVHAKDGMAYIVHLAQSLEEDKWRGVRRALEDYCFKLTESISDDIALNAEKSLGDARSRVRKEAYERVAGNSSPLIRVNDRWQLRRPESQKQLLGTSSHATELAGDSFRQAIPKAQVSVKSNNRGSSVAIQQIYLLSSVKLRAIEEMRTHYMQHIAEKDVNILLRHSDKRWYRYPDIYHQPDASYWSALEERLSLALPAIVLGVLKWQHTDQDSSIPDRNRTKAFVGEFVQNGMKVPTTVGHTIEQVVRALAEEKRHLYPEIQTQVAKKQAEIVSLPALQAYSAGLVHLVEQTFPSETKARGGAMPNPRNGIANNLVMDVVHKQLAQAVLHRELGPTDVRAEIPEVAQSLEAGNRALSEIDYWDPQCRSAVRVIDWSKVV